MNKLGMMNVFGLKCDRAGCGYEDMSIQYQDYDKWIDAPCPKCGHSLLTQEDYDFCKKMEEVLEVREERPSDVGVFKIDLDGTGVPKAITRIDPVGKPEAR